MKFLREIGLMSALIILGTFLLVVFWLSMNIRKSFFETFNQSQVSVIVKDGMEEPFRHFLDQHSGVVHYEVFTRLENKLQLGALYSELQSVIDSMEDHYFPVSALITVLEPDAFLVDLDTKPFLSEAKILHKPPAEISRFLNVLVISFLGLWLLTLTLMLYFHLERLAIREEPRWSLMKTLGAKSSKLLWPLLGAQVLRVSLASLLAMIAAFVVIERVEGLLTWHWHVLGWGIHGTFFFLSAFLTAGISALLFQFRYSRMALG